MHTASSLLNKISLWEDLKRLSKMSFLFKGKAAIVEEKKDPTTLAKEWRRNLAKEARSIERDVRLRTRLSTEYYCRV